MGEKQSVTNNSSADSKMLSVQVAKEMLIKIILIKMGKGGILKGEIELDRCLGIS